MSRRLPGPPAGAAARRLLRLFAPVRDALWTVGRVIGAPAGGGLEPADDSPERATAAPVGVADLERALSAPAALPYGATGRTWPGPAIASLIKGPAGADPALLVCSRSVDDADWTTGFAWLDGLAATPHGPAADLARRALATWLEGPPAGNSGTGGQDGGWDGPEAVSDAVRRGLRLLRLAPLLADPDAPGAGPAATPWFDRDRRGALAARLAGDVDRIERCLLQQTGPAGGMSAPAAVACALGLCAIGAALPAAFSGPTRSRHHRRLAGALTQAIEEAAMEPAELQRWAAAIDRLLAAGTGSPEAELGRAVTMLVRALALLRRDDGSLAGFGGGPGDPHLNASFAPVRRDGSPAALSAPVGLCGGYGRIGGGGTCAWMALAQDRSGQGHGPLPVELETADGLLLLACAPVPAPVRAPPPDRSTPPTGRSGAAFRPVPDSPLQLRIRETADSRVLEAVAQAGATRCDRTRRITIDRQGSRIDGLDCLAGAPDGAGRTVPVIWTLFLPVTSGSTATCEGSSVVFVTQGGTAWRLYAEALDFRSGKASYDRVDGRPRGVLSVSGQGEMICRRGLAELRWSLIREA